VSWEERMSERAQERLRQERAEKAQGQCAEFEDSIYNHLTHHVHELQWSMALECADCDVVIPPTGSFVVDLEVPQWICTCGEAGVRPWPNEPIVL
jgi:hypothetical protein